MTTKKKLKFGETLTEMLEAVANDLEVEILDEPDYEALSKHFPIDLLNSQAESIPLKHDRIAFALGKLTDRTRKLVEYRTVLDAFFNSLYDSEIYELGGGLNTLAMIYLIPKTNFNFVRENTIRDIWVGHNGDDIAIIFRDGDIFRTFTTQDVESRENSFDLYAEAVEFFNGGDSKSVLETSKKPFEKD